MVWLLHLFWSFTNQERSQACFGYRHSTKAPDYAQDFDRHTPFSWHELSVSSHDMGLVHCRFLLISAQVKLGFANHSSRPTASQLKCVSDTISNLFENHQPQKTKISTVISAPFIQNWNQMASRLTATTSFPRVFFQLLQFSRQRPSFSAHKAALMTKTDCLDFSSILFKICRFRSSTQFGCRWTWSVWNMSLQPAVQLVYGLF